MEIYVDVDNTLCVTSGCDYRGAIPVRSAIDKINRLHGAGNRIVIYTARGTLNGVSEELISLTRDQLNSWGVKYDELRFSKPAYDLMICDKTKRIEEM